ncbi:MAG TPA: XrtA/PEP-CTERM system TPR-repeat protein PrsT [Steroidobacteraceae bacterium]|nr:XrtA/PEP-CTERM system TPR-repeat protein PrsT [Steroidobacteraceae bacterium]
MGTANRIERSKWRHRAGLAAMFLASAACIVALHGCDMFVSTDTRVERAQKLMAAGEYPRAMRELKSALESEPQHVPSRLSLAELMLRLGDVKGADKEIERATAAGATPQQTRGLHYESLVAQRAWEPLLQELQQDEQTPLLDRQLLEAEAREAVGQYAEAERVLGQVSSAAEPDSRVRLQRTRLLAATGHTDEALALSAKITEPKGVRAKALTVAATIQMSRGQYQAARAMLTEALELSRVELAIPEQLLIAATLTESSLALQDLAAANKALEFMQQRGGDSLIAHYYRARIALLKNDYTQAVAECQRALAIDPNHVPTNLMLAAAHIGHGSLEQAEEVLQRLVAADPRNLAARKMLARVYLATRRPNDALRLLEASGAGAPDDAQADWLMGIALAQSGSTESGLAYLERSVATAAPDDERRLDLAAAYLGAGAVEKARALLAGLPSSKAGDNRVAALRLATAVSGKARADALQEVERLIANSPDAAMLSAAGAYLMGTGQVQRSQEVLTLAADRDARSVNSRMLLAALAARRLEWKSATQRLDEVLAIDPKYQPAFLMRAELAVRQGDRAGAQRTLEEAIGRDPSALEPRLRLARLAFANNDAARGRDLLKQTLTLLPGRADVRNAVGAVLLQAGLHEEALVHFAEAGAGGSAEGMLNAARVHMQLNRPEQAAEAANAALRLQPGWREAQRMLIEIDVQRGQIDRAVAAARAQAGPNPPPGATDEMVGDVYAFAKRYDDALASYESAQRARPSAVLALKTYRVRQALNRKPVEASLVAWLKNHPDDTEMRRALASYYDITNQRALAIAQYELAVKQAPQDSLLLNNLAWQLHVVGDARAVSLAHRAYQLTPHIPEIADTYGWLLAQTGERQQGLEVLEQALAGAPANPDIRYHVAKVRSQVGNRSGALQILDDLLKDRASFASRAEAQQLLEALRGEGP